MTKQWPNYNSNTWEDDGRWYVQLNSRLPCGCTFGGKANDPKKAVAEQLALRDLSDNRTATDAQCIARGKHPRRQK